MNTELLMIRHGQSEANAGLCTEPDCSLTELGRQQGQGAGRLLSGHDLRGFIGLTSPFERARQTAACITELSGIAFKVEPLLREWQWGEAHTVQGNHYAVETVAELAARLEQFLDRYENQRVVAVSHAGPIAVLTQLAWGEDLNPQAAVTNGVPRWLKVTRRPARASR